MTDERVLRLLEDAIESGRTPEEVCAHAPHLLEEVRRHWHRARALEARIDTLFPAARSARGAATSAADASPPDIPGYTLDTELGRGGMGTVWRAHRAGHPATAGSTVALKVLHRHLVGMPGLHARFLREAELGTRVVHENVVRAITFGTARSGAAERPFLVTEYVEGQTLRAVLRELGRVPEDLCRHVGREVARGLAAIHAAGAVHRDLKPENVLITSTHVVKVMDLGVAKLSGAADDLSLAGAFVGSIRYAAPEQLERKGPLDGRADLYALGVTLHELATGVHPVRGDDFASIVRAVLEESPPRLGDVAPQVSPFFEEVLACLLEKDPGARFPSATDLAGVLDQGERSAWWLERSRVLRTAAMRPLRKVRLPRETALHGRAEAMARLSALFSDARSGDGQVVLVEGEAGVGKSRLVGDFVSLLADSGQDADVLVGGYAPGGAATAISAFAAAFRERLGEDRLEAALAARLGAVPSLVPCFAAALRGEPPPAGSAPPTKDALHTAFVRTAQSLARERPTLIVIEDLHLAPEEGRALFAALAHAVTAHRILLVGTARRSLDEAWAAEIARLPQSSKLALARLTPADVTALLRDALGSAPVADDLSPIVFEKTDGNPHFVFEILRDLRECRLLAQAGDGTWAPTKVIGHIRSPSSIRDLIQARVAKLAAEDRELLHVAACCGFEFDPLLAGDVLQLPRFLLLRRLGVLEASHRLVRSAGRLYAFDHHQVQEVLYAGLSETHRESYHAAIASTLERTSGAAAGDPEHLDGALCVDLARHFLEGSDGVRALRYLERAYAHLEKGSRPEIAARLLGRALAAPGLLAGARRFGALLHLASRLAICGSAAEEATVLREANALADALGDAALQAAARNDLGVHLARVSHNQDALGLLEDAAAIQRRLGDMKGEAAATGNAGSVLAALGRYDEARIRFERRLELARLSADRRNEAAALSNLGNLFLALGRPDDARTYIQRGAAVAAEIGDRRMAVHAAGNLGNVFVTLGRFPEAQAQYEETLARSRELGDRASEARATGSLAIVFESLGRYADAKAHGERCLALSRECAARAAEAVAAMNLGLLFSSLGRRDDALAHLGDARRIAGQIGSKQIAVSAMTYTGDALSDLGRFDEARPMYEQALALARTIGNRLGEARALQGIGSTLAAQGSSDAAARTLDEALALARRVDSSAAAVLAAADRASLPGGDPAAAASLLASYGERVSVEARLRARWTLWRATHAPEHLAEARRLLDFIVEHAPPDCRTALVEDVGVHREIAAAARDAGP